MRGQWIQQPETLREHQCSPLSWDEVIEERLPPQGYSDPRFIWECPEPDCKRWWEYSSRGVTHSNGISELEVTWNLVRPKVPDGEIYYKSVGEADYVVVTTDAASKATWVVPNKYSDGW